MIYTVVTHYSLVELVKEINNLLAQGWKLQGGISITTSGIGSEEYTSFAQAITRKKKVTRG